MKFPPSLLEEIRARLPVSAVVGRRVKLTKAGREWKGLSPFNAEKSPSFFVNDQKGFYHDFSSGKHGDIFSFLMETEGLAFPEAVERLALEAGVAMPMRSEEAEREESRAKGLIEAMALAAEFFVAELSGPRGAKARNYLENRGLSRSVWAEFGLGFAPAERFALRDFLAGKGVSAEVMKEAGLLVFGEDIAVPYDRFRDRVMFPIHDARGRVIAFGGRALSAEVAAKYLNSPDTPLFHKGRVLYNHHRARKAVHDAGTVVAVEGYVDVIAMARAGIAHAVAPLGTALTEDQLGLLWRLADEPILCFDGDKAGKRAAFRAIDVAFPLLQAGKSLRFALLPEGQDPDDLFKSGGAQALEAVLARAMPLVDLFWARGLEAQPVDTPERRAAFEKRIKAEIQAIPDESLRKLYRDEISKRIQQHFEAATPLQARAPARGPVQRGYGRRFMPPPPGAAIREAIRPSASLSRTSIFSPAGAVSPREALILVTFFEEPDRLAAHAENLGQTPFSHPDTRALAALALDMVMRAQAEGHSLDGAALQAEITRKGLESAWRRLLAAVRPGDRFSADPSKKIELDMLLQQAMTLHRRALVLHTELRAAERAFSEEPSDSNFALLAELKAQLMALDGTEAEPEPEPSQSLDRPSGFR